MRVLRLQKVIGLISNLDEDEEEEGSLGMEKSGGQAPSSLLTRSYDR